MTSLRQATPASPSLILLALASLLMPLTSCVTTGGAGDGSGTGEFTVHKIQADLFDTHYVAAPSTPVETLRLKASAKLVDLCLAEGFTHFILLEKTETMEPAPAVTVAVRLFGDDPKISGVFDATALKAEPSSVL